MHNDEKHAYFLPAYSRLLCQDLQAHTIRARLQDQTLPHPVNAILPKLQRRWCIEMERHCPLHLDLCQLRVQGDYHAL